MIHSEVAPAQRSRVLVARGLDGLLVGWLAVIVWVGFYVVHQLSPSTSVPGLMVIYWTGAVLTAAHFGLSYHLAYRDGLAAVRKRPLVLGYAPALLIAVLTVFTLMSLAGGGAATQRSTSALITTVYLLTTWHYIKQAYGVARLGAAYAGVKLTKTEADVLRYGLYPLWFLGAAQVLVKTANYRLAGFRVGFALLPGDALPVLRTLALVAAIPIVVVLTSAARRHHRFPPSGLLAPYVAAFLWLGLPTNAALTLLLLAPFHALQYLAVGHRAEIALAEDTEKDLRWWANIFVGAACGGLLLSRWVPNLLDTHVHRSGGPLLFAAAFFVFLNLHHYLIDAAIWRSSGELIKAMGRKPGAIAAPAGTPTGSPALSST